jgi:hypothetical protein
VLLEALRYRLAATACTTTHVHVVALNANNNGLYGVEKRRQQAIEACGAGVLNVKRFHF